MIIFSRRSNSTIKDTFMAKQRMIIYQKANANRYQEFLNLLLEHMADYNETLMEQMGMSIEEFRDLLKTVGQVYSINCEQEVAGYYWVEQKGMEIHLHGIIVKDKYQRAGIGTMTLKMLEEEYKGRMEYIELCVHQANKGAIRLYEQLGYQTIAMKEDPGFYIMRNNLQ